MSQLHIVFGVCVFKKIIKLTKILGVIYLYNFVFTLHINLVKALKCSIKVDKNRNLCQAFSVKFVTLTLCAFEIYAL